MRLNIFARACGLAACVVFAAAATGQQPARARRGGLDNLSLAPAPERDAAGSAWQTFAPEGAGFSVELPGVPADEAGDGRDAGRLNPSVRDYKLSADGVEYQIARTGQLPQAVYESEGFVEKFFDSLSESLTASAAREWPQMKLKPTAARAVSLGGHDGREFELASAGYRSRVRVFLVDRAMFIVAMTGAREAFTDEKIERYFGSLRLNGQ